MKNMTFDINQVVELRTRTLDYFGVGAIQKFNDIAVNLKKDGIDKVIIVSSKSAYITTGAWDVIKPALEANNIHYILYNRVTPNPTDSSTDEATAFGRDFGAQAVIGIATWQKALPSCWSIPARPLPICINLSSSRKKQNR